MRKGDGTQGSWAEDLTGFGGRPSKRAQWGEDEDELRGIAEGAWSRQNLGEAHV